MIVLTGAALMLSAAAAATVPSHVPSQGVRRVVKPATTVTYQANQIESYFTKEQIGYIRPGFKVTLVGITNVAPGQKPVVEIRYTDDMDQPLDFAGKVTPGALSISFMLAWWDPDTRQYHAYTFRNRGGVIGPGDDRGGRWNHLELGHSTYTFNTVMPANMDVTKTTTLTIYGRRSLRSLIGKDYIFNNINYDFRPDGQPVTDTWAAMDATACNTCHDPLAGHGGPRNTPKNCVLCHQPELPADAVTGNSYDFKEMIHRIHMGKNLPSVKAGGRYGFGTNVDFSTVAYPQDIRNCTTCHQRTAPEGHIWYTNPSRKACGSCHDDIDFEAGVGHPPQADDSACASCHRPEGEFEFDASIKGAHVIPTKSAQLRGLGIEILGVTGAAPGGKITVTFRTFNKDDGSFVPPSTLNSCNFLLGGPTSEYTQYLRGDARGATVSGETATYTFTNPIPEDATGTWALSADVYRNVTLDPGPTAAVREAAQNPFRLVPVTDPQPLERRDVVDLAKCNKCHDVLALHGGQRFKIEECVICHHPNETDTSRRPADRRPAESVHMKYMIHRIHTGEELEREYTVYGFGGTPHNYNEVLYPGDRRNCEACHKPNTYGLPLPEEALPTPTLRDWYTPMQPGAASCLSCHSSVHAAAHAYVNTAPFGEACASCHGADREYSVVKSHAR
ncbi:MAG TPA: OmcA/MtrC family decaheme c-type cytochrome [Thermoanaerobaculaceae bacterium]|nr:OmcA/MtrC family decaheme c-type cytochrome [Thermoanaerobaculaceae bacterium]HRS17011.1 OmcA/MtrC family decaheme c-type cytochrome [Thermoanaerobaculaceae bacterium]